MILETFLAFSWVMPSLIAIAIRYSLPETLGSAASRCFREMLRLTSFSLNTSRIALARSSLLARISTPSWPDQAMDAPTLRKSNRVLISLAAWLSALSASWRSILDTMSKLDSLGMDHRVDGYGAARHLGRASRGRAYVVVVVANRLAAVCVATARDVRYSSLCCRRSAAVHGRLPEWPKGTVCKTVGSAYVGSNPTPATICEDGPLAGNSRLCEPFFLCPVVYHLVAQ